MALSEPNKNKGWIVKGIIAALAGMAIMSCGGCGGGGDGNQPAQPSVVAPQPKAILIEAYGDSTTEGWQVINGVGANSPNNEPAMIQAGLTDQLGGSVTVSNQGVGSSEASQLVNGTDGRHLPWAQQMANSKAQIVLLNFSLNDAYFITVSGWGEPETPETYGQYLTQLVQTAKSAGKQVVLQEPHPVCEPVREPALPNYITKMREVAQAQGIPLVAQYDHIKGLGDWKGMLSDCLHPLDPLYKLKADRTAAVLLPMVKALQ